MSAIGPDGYRAVLGAVSADIQDNPQYHTNKWDEFAASNPQAAGFFRDRLYALTGGNGELVSKAMSSLVEALDVAHRVSESATMSRQIGLPPEFDELAGMAPEEQLEALDAMEGWENKTP